VQLPRAPFQSLFEHSAAAPTASPRLPSLPYAHIAPAALRVHFPSSRVAAPAAYRGTVASSGRPSLRQTQDRPFDTRPLARSLLRTREWRGAEGRKSPCSKAGRRRIPASMRCVNPVGPRAGASGGVDRPFDVPTKWRKAPARGRGDGICPFALLSAGGGRRDGGPAPFCGA